MKTAKEIIIDTCHKHNDCILPGQMKWIIEAMENYADQFRQPAVIKLVCDVCAGTGIDDGNYYEPPCGKCKGTGKPTLLN